MKRIWCNCRNHASADLNDVVPLTPEMAKVVDAEIAEKQALEAMTALKLRHAKEEEDEKQAALLRAQKRENEIKAAAAALSAARKDKTIASNEALRCAYHAWVDERNRIARHRCSAQARRFTLRHL